MGMTGQTLEIGNYLVFAERIGAGGQGTVLKGVHKSTGDKVAIKTINLVSTGSRLAFEAEYQAMSKLSSNFSNVCKIEEAIIDEDRGYIVMKRYDCDLFAYAFEMRENPLPEQEVKIIFTKICRGVRNLHRNRIAHLDLKPENILLDLDTLEPYICDFGSAFTSSSTKTCRRKTRATLSEVPALGYRGTRKFSSPEIQLFPNQYDPYRADIFSLGIILHILITGYYPKSETDDDGNVVRDWTYAKEAMSPSCYDLLTSLTHYSPTERLYIDEVLDHPWIKPSRRKSIAKLTHKLFS